MKNFVLVTSIVFLSACSIIPSKFDSVLYNESVDTLLIVDNAIENNTCSSEDQMKLVTVDLATKTHKLVKYSQYVSPDIYPALVLIDKDAVEFKVKYNTKAEKAPSPTYCGTKLEILSGELEKITSVLGGKSNVPI